jgi:hypothetical protein
MIKDLCGGLFLFDIIYPTMKSQKRNNKRNKSSALVRLNAHVENNKIYYALLELTILLGSVYLVSIGDLRIIHLLQMPWLTDHISNLLGTMFLMLLISGKDSFKGTATVRPYVAACIMVSVNLALEFSQSIDVLNLPFGIKWGHFNTADPIDAVYGILGVLIILLSIKLTRRKVLSLNKTP